MGKGNPFKKIFDPIKKGVLFLKCSIRIITNFPKCITFYVLDYLKYIFLFVPLMVFSICTGQGKKGIKRNSEMLENLLKWSPETQYKCYICKKKKAKKKVPFYTQLIQAIFNPDANGMSLIFFFVMCVIFLIGFGYFMFLAPTQAE